MANRMGFIVVLALVILVTGAFSMYQVAEWERAILFRLGEIVRTDIKPGLHFKFPFINNVRKFDGRVVTLDSQPERFFTQEQKALIIDSWFDAYVGVISLIRVVNGVIRPKDKMRVMSTGRVYQVEKVGVFTPKRLDKSELGTGEVGFVIAGIKEVDGAPVGDTLTLPTPAGPRAWPVAGIFIDYTSDQGSATSRHRCSGAYSLARASAASRSSTTRIAP